MRRVQFVQVGPDDILNAAIHNLATALDGAQDFYEFDFDDEVLPTPASPRAEPFPDAALEELILSFARDLREPRFPIAITSAPLAGELFCINDEDRYAVISTHLLDEFIEQEDRVRTFAYLIAPILLDRRITAPVHDRPRQCPNDYADDPRDILPSLANAQFCSECRRRMIKGLERGVLTLGEFVSISRILDFAAQRTVCFVMMPFTPKKIFSSVYAAIRRAVSKAGLHCVRADEIFESRDIMQMIVEGIHRAEIVVADLTGRNPNVFYELGLAHSLSKETVLLATDIEDLPFDLRQRKHIEYRPDRNGLRALERDLLRYLPSDERRMASISAAD